MIYILRVRHKISWHLFRFTRNELWNQDNLIKKGNDLRNKRAIGTKRRTHRRLDTTTSETSYPCWNEL